VPAHRTAHRIALSPDVAMTAQIRTAELDFDMEDSDSVAAEVG
jgi:hypothetical protein